MGQRILRYFAIPMIISIALSLAWGVGMLYLWRAVGKTAGMLVEGTPANRVASRLSRVDEAMAPVILYCIAALLIPLALWFITCVRKKVVIGEARKLRPLWFSLFLLSTLIAGIMVYWQGFIVGGLGNYMSSASILIHALLGFVTLFLAYWLISMIATNRLYRPATLPI